MFFKKFSTIPYALDGYSKDAMSIITAAVLKHINVDQSYVYQKYIIPSGASPESLAYQLYGDAEKYWTILYVNAIVDPFTEWPMAPEILEEWVEKKYGDINKVLHFVDVVSGEYFDDVEQSVLFSYLEEGSPIPHNAHPVTALDYESNLNRQRGEIVVISPKYINTFVDMFNKSIEGKS